MARTHAGGGLLASFGFAGAAGSSQNFEHTVNFSICSSQAWSKGCFRSSTRLTQIRVGGLFASFGIVAEANAQKLLIFR